MDDNFNSKKNFDKDNHVVGHYIRAPKVIVIDSDNVNHGVLTISEALKMAEQIGLDLVQVAGGGKDKPPTCKILNYEKFKYEASKRAKAALKKQRENEIKTKEIKFRPSTSENDLKIKAKHAEEFLKEGYRLKVSLVFKGREASYQSLGLETFNTFISMVPNANIINKPSLEGRELIAIVVKKIEERIEKVG